MKKYRLVTYNIHKGVGPFRSLSTLDRVKISLRESKADFLLLQELVGEREISRTKTERQLEALADARWPFHAYGKNAIFPTRNHGNAILSALPIRKHHNHDLTIYPVERRSILHCEMDHKTNLHLCSVHLDLFEFTRKIQVDKMVKYLKKLIPADAPLIIGGDFNDWAQKIGPRLHSELGLREYLSPTFPSWSPLLPLDRIYVRNVKIQDFQRYAGDPWSQLSDHLPLSIEFSL